MKTTKNNYPKSIQAGLAALALLCAQAAQADQQVSAGFGLPVHVNAIVDESGCENHPGPTITLSGEIKLGGLNARMTFMNTTKGTHAATVVSQYDVSLLLAGSAIEIPKQPVQGGVGGNPHIITLDGDLVLGGLHARIIFRNNVKGTHTAEDKHDVAIVLEGSKIVLPKQPVKGGVGDNPIISIQFLHGDGTPIGEPVVLGRCVQL